MSTQHIDDGLPVRPTAYRPESGEDGKIRFARPELLDAGARGDQGAARNGDLREEGIDQGRLPNSRVPTDEDDLPLPIENRLEDVPQEVHLRATTDQTRRGGTRLDLLRWVGH